MPVIKPITDLRNTNEISELCHKQQQPVFITEYYGAAEPPVRCGESHLSGLTEPPQFVY